MSGGALGRLWRRLLDLLYPPRCPFCHEAREEEAICPDCQKTLPWLTGTAAQRKLDHIKLCASALAYHDQRVRQCVHRYKFGRRQGYQRILGPLVAQCARDHFSMDFDLISWPSLSPRKLRRRGFDQAQLLARAVARDRGMGETALFRKSNRAGQQSRLQSHAARRANVLGAFSLLDPEQVAGKRVLLVDDVVTSGSTLSECARLLLTAGAKEVWAVTLANAGGPRKGT